ncbi:MAG: ribosome recycling factor [Patescibacteria group bacterium]
MSIIDNHLADFNKAIEHLIEGLAALKTGRANPAILDGVMVNVYETKMPLNQVASINVPEVRCIVVQAWDKNINKEIEKAISESGLGLNPVNEGDKIRITLPLMTEETRQEIVKVLHHKLEEARIAVRNVREHIKEEILAAEKNKEFGEDEKYRLIEELDKKTGEYNDKIKKIGDDREREIMTV